MDSYGWICKKIILFLFYTKIRILGNEKKIVYQFSYSCYSLVPKVSDRIKNNEIYDHYLRYIIQNELINI